MANTRSAPITIPASSTLLFRRECDNKLRKAGSRSWLLRNTPLNPINLTINSSDENFAQVVVLDYCQGEDIKTMMFLFTNTGWLHFPAITDHVYFSDAHMRLISAENASAGDIKKLIELLTTDQAFMFSIEPFTIEKLLRPQPHQADNTRLGQLFTTPMLLPSIQRKYNFFNSGLTTSQSYHLTGSEGIFELQVIIQGTLEENTYRFNILANSAAYVLVDLYEQCSERMYQVKPALLGNREVNFDEKSKILFINAGTDKGYVEEQLQIIASCCGISEKLMDDIRNDIFENNNQAENKHMNSIL